MIYCSRKCLSSYSCEKEVISVDNSSKIYPSSCTTSYDSVGKVLKLDNILNTMIYCSHKFLSSYSCEKVVISVDDFGKIYPPSCTTFYDSVGKVLKIT